MHFWQNAFLKSTSQVIFASKYAPKHYFILWRGSWGTWHCFKWNCATPACKIVTKLRQNRLSKCTQMQLIFSLHPFQNTTTLWHQNYRKINLNFIELLYLSGHLKYVGRGQNLDLQLLGLIFLYETMMSCYFCAS